jgi:hypothetical protein
MLYEIRLIQDSPPASAPRCRLSRDHRTFVIPIQIIKKAKLECHIKKLFSKYNVKY